jgi:hypothetical protein
MKTAFQIIEKAIKNSSMYITNVVDPMSDDEVRLYATDGAGLTIMVEYDRIHPEDCSIEGNDNHSRLVITDECSDGNFAILIPKRGNMRSLSACMRIGMDNIIENAEA